MAGFVNAHHTALGLVLVLLITALGSALLFGWGTGGPPNGAILVTPPSPPAQATAAPAVPAIPAASSPPAATAPAGLKVYITGAVLHPGVYNVNSATRISDLLTAAGGPAPDADLERVNLAARLQDEEQVVIPHRGTPGPAAPAPPVPAGANAPAPPAGAKTPTGPLNINTADAASLEALPGIGPVLAERIVQYRATHGPFARIEAIQDVPGIGAKLFAEMQPYISVGP